LKLAAVSTIMGYTISVLMAVVGILVLTGVLMAEGMTMELRVLFGIVLVLYSVYRFMVTRARTRQEEESSDE
jgi:prolipoprotein diacylglyceryltransferase